MLYPRELLGLSNVSDVKQCIVDIFKILISLPGRKYLIRSVPLDDDLARMGMRKITFHKRRLSSFPVEVFVGNDIKQTINWQMLKQDEYWVQQIIGAIKKWRGFACRLRQVYTTLIVMKTNLTRLRQTSQNIEFQIEVSNTRTAYSNTFQTNILSDRMDGNCDSYSNQIYSNFCRTTIQT